VEKLVLSAGFFRSGVACSLKAVGCPHLSAHGRVDVFLHLFGGLPGPAQMGRFRPLIMQFPQNVHVERG